MANRVDVRDKLFVTCQSETCYNRWPAVRVELFWVVERLNISETKITLLEKDLQQAVEMLETDLEKNTEFRIKWPRGEMGSLPADSKQFMLIEDLYKTVEKLEEHIESMQNNKINISFLQEQMKKAKEDIERLKDADREIVYKNGNGN